MKSYDNFEFDKVEINKDLKYLKFIHKDKSVFKSEKDNDSREKVKLEDVIGIIEDGEKTNSVELKRSLYDY